MSAFERYLNWITRMQFLFSAGLLGSFVVGVMSLCGVFGPVWDIILGVTSGAVLIASIAGLWNMSNRVFEAEEGFHRRNYDGTTVLLNSIHQPKQEVTTA